jgi:hypothetical protein
VSQRRYQAALFAGLASLVIAGCITIPAVAHAEACVNGTVRPGGQPDYIQILTQTLTRRLSLALLGL